MSAKFEWTPGGKVLLSTIQSYIIEQGGKIALLKAIMKEDREIRRELYVNSYSAYIVKYRKRVRAHRDNKSFDFETTSGAATLLNTDTGNIRAAIRYGSKHKGYRFEYID